MLGRALRRANRRLRRLAAGAGDERPIARDRFARGGDDAVGFVVVDQRRFAVRAEHDEAGERRATQRASAARRRAGVDAVADRRTAWERARRRRRDSSRLIRTPVARRVLQRQVQAEDDEEHRAPPD